MGYHTGLELSLRFIACEIEDVRQCLACFVAIPGVGPIAASLPCVFMFRTGNSARIDIRTAFGLGRAGLAGLFQSAITRHSFAGRPTVRVRAVSAHLPQRVTLRPMY